MKTVIEMAREAGFVLTKSEWVYVDMLERFAELARADAIADEREACAKVCETQDGAGPAYEHWWEFSAAIRARSNT